MTQVSMVPVYEFQLADGTPIGCGTQVELDYWTEQGVFDGYKLGPIICHEPASEDDRRRKAWGVN